MGGMEFEFDEKGGAFYYFLLSFIALVLIPATYYLWPSGDKRGSKNTSRECQCDKCLVKRELLKAQEPWKNVKNRITKIIIIIGWIVMIYVAYKTTQVEIDYTEFDPFTELEIDRGASGAEIKKAYRRLSLVYHPDKETGDSHRFMRITKAYQALTDEEAKKNWEEYGNPDGPGAMHFGIALPKWIVEKQNSIWVLAVYGIIFMVILPVAVGTWWYKSIKYSSEKILIDTQRLYLSAMFRFNNMNTKICIQKVLAASFEYDPAHNSRMAFRAQDNDEVVKLTKELTLFEKNIKNEWPYRVKARAVLAAHMEEVPLPAETLEKDRQYMVRLCPYLLSEMINMGIQAFFMVKSGQMPQSSLPHLNSFETIMKVSQLMVQGLKDKSSQLRQLPHITDDILKHFKTKKRNIRSVSQFAALPHSERRSLLRTLSDKEYQDIMNVVAIMPNVDIDVTCKVLDDEDSEITAGATVTVTIHLTRTNISVSLDDSVIADNRRIEDDPVDDVSEAAEDAHSTDGVVPSKAVTAAAAAAPVWKRKNKLDKSKKKKSKPAAKPDKKAALAIKAESNGSTAAASGDSKAVAVSQAGDESGDEQHSDAGSDSEGAGDDGGDEGTSQQLATKGGAEKSNDSEDEDNSWEEIANSVKKESVLETKSKETHVVHCPSYPAIKYEWWWLYVVDRKVSQIIRLPTHITSLKDEEEVQLKFLAPTKPGVYNYTVVLRSDSYVDLDFQKQIKLDVKEAKKQVAVEHKWDTDDEKAVSKKQPADSDNDNDWSESGDGSDDD